MGVRQLARDPAVERRVVALALLLERQRRDLEGVQDVAEVQFGERANGLCVVGQTQSPIAGISPVLRSGVGVTSST